MEEKTVSVDMGGIGTVTDIGLWAEKRDATWISETD